MSKKTNLEKIIIEHYKCHQTNLSQSTKTRLLSVKEKKKKLF